MNCINCKEKFYVQRSFLKLFETRTYYVCDSCRKEHPLDLALEKVVLDQYELWIVSLFQKKEKVNYHAWTEEVSRIFWHFHLKYSDFFVLFLEEVRLTDEVIEISDCISKMQEKSLLIITFFLKK